MRPLGERSPMDARHGARGILRQVGDLDRGRRQVRADLDHPDPVLREDQHERLVREGDRAQQRLEVEAIGDLAASLSRFGSR